MDAQTVLNASILDIVFEGRNKDYGAYRLRKDYSKTVLIALGWTGIFVTALLVLNQLNGKSDVQELVRKQVVTIDLVNLPKRAVQPPPVIPPKPQVQPRTRILRITTPVIVKDPPKQEIPPENDQADNTKIGVINEAGTDDDNMVPQQGSQNGVIASLKRQESDDDQIFSVVEIESMYPGGAAAWMRFLVKTFHYPRSAQDNGVQGTVIVQFIVDATGQVSNVRALEGPQELQSEAVSVIKRSGAWTPAIQNGRKVKSYKLQPITFHLEE